MEWLELVENISIRRMLAQFSGPGETTKAVKHLLYFPGSLVNILTEKVLDDSIQDYEVTWVLAKSKYAVFVWDFGKYHKTIVHAKNYLPELEIRTGFIKFSGFYNIVGYFSKDPTIKFSFTFVVTNEGPRTVKPMILNPLQRPLVEPSKNVWRDSIQSKTPPSPLKIDESIHYKN